MNRCRYLQRSRILWDTIETQCSISWRFSAWVLRQKINHLTENLFCVFLFFSNDGFSSSNWKIFFFVHYCHKVMYLSYEKKSRVDKITLDGSVFVFFFFFPVSSECKTVLMNEHNWQFNLLRFNLIACCCIWYFFPFFLSFNSQQYIRSILPGARYLVEFWVPVN